MLRHFSIFVASDVERKVSIDLGSVNVTAWNRGKVGLMVAALSRGFFFWI